MDNPKNPSSVLEVPQTISKWPSLRGIRDDWQGLQKPSVVHHSEKAVEEEFDWSVNHLKGNSCFSRLLISGPNEYRSIKLFFILLCGVFAGMITIFLLHFSYDFDLEIKTGSIGLAVAFATSMLLILCNASRCVLSLVLPSLGTRQGKTILMAILAAQLLSGPMGNLTYNMKQTTNSLVCFSNMTVNQTQQISKGIRDSINNFTQKLRMNELGQVVDAVQGFKNIFDEVSSIFSFGIQEKIEESIGIDVLRRQIKNATKSLKDAKTQTKNNLHAAKRNVTEEVNVHLRQFLDVTKFLKLATILSLVFLLFSCWLYYFRFRHSLAYDNVYATHLLKRFDHHCGQSGGIKLFPLRPRERKKIIDSISLQMSPTEKRALIISLIIYVVHSVVTIALCFADWTLYTFMKIIERNVNGSVAWNETAIFTISKIDFKMEIPIDYDAQKCVAVPRELQSKTLMLIVIIYVVLGLAVISQAYCLRFRHAIVAFFYPERNSERIQYLYYKLLEKREKSKFSFKFRLIFHRVENAGVSGVSQNSSGVAKTSLLVSTGQKFGMFRRKCLACGLSENSEFKNCPNTPPCSSTFCLPCFGDMNNTCYVCQSPKGIGNMN